MVVDSEDDILVWNSSVGPDENQYGESDSNVNEDILESDSIFMPSDSEDDTTMVDTEESDNSVYEKKYFKISEVETIIGETQSTIRFWEESFADLGRNFCSQRSRGGTRKFTKENIENLQLIKLLLRERRLTIEGAISEIKNDRRRNAKEKALILLDETRKELNDLIDAYNCVLHQKCQ